MALFHKLWIIDDIRMSRLTGNQSQDLNDVEKILNGFDHFWRMRDSASDIVRAVLVTGSSAPASANDAVCFVVRENDHSVISRSGRDASRGADRKVAGLSSFGTGPGTVVICEVYWQRLNNSIEVANAIFHEAAHGLSRQGESMHKFSSGGGGSGVRVLGENLPWQKTKPSLDDIDFYKNHIGGQHNFKSSI